MGIGGDFHYHNARARLMTQFGVYSQLTPRNDPSPSRGQFNLGDMYRYLSEAYGSYHIDKMHGINIDAGIFMSYIGLFGYYNYDNWTYQPSYVSANTPWFFTDDSVTVKYYDNPNRPLTNAAFSFAMDHTPTVAAEHRCGPQLRQERSMRVGRVASGRRACGQVDSNQHGRNRHHLLPLSKRPLGRHANKCRFQATERSDEHATPRSGDSRERKGT